MPKLCLKFITTNNPSYQISDHLIRKVPQELLRCSGGNIYIRNRRKSHNGVLGIMKQIEKAATKLTKYIFGKIFKSNK